MKKDKLTKPVLVILHGWAYSKEKWSTLVSLLEKNFTVLLPSIPGLTADLKSSWTLDDYVTWLDEVTKELDSFYLVGHSNGGRISIAYTLKNSQRVKGLILIDSAGIIDRRISSRLKKVVLGTASKVLKPLKYTPLRKIIYILIGEKDYEKANPILQKTMTNLISVDLEPRLTEITQKTAIIWGREDRVTPPFMAESFLHSLKNAQIFWVEGAKHSPQFTHSQYVAKQIQTFIIEK